MALNLIPHLNFRNIPLDDKVTLVWGDHLFEAGAGADFMETTVNFDFELDPELQAIINSNPQSRVALDDLKDVKKYNRYRAFVQNNFKVNDRLFIQPGLRTDYYDILDKFYLAPRIGISYAINNLTTLRFVTGMYFQSPGYEKLRDQNVLYNLDKKYTQDLNAERALHFILGVDRWLSTSWNLKLETYYKDFSNLITPSESSGFTIFYGDDSREGSNLSHRMDQACSYYGGFINPDTNKQL